MMLGIAEMFSIICALSAQIALGFLRENEEAESVLMRWPLSSPYAKEAFAIFTFWLLFLATISSALSFVICSLGGVHEHVAFYTGVVNLLKIPLGLFFLGWYCILVLSFWHSSMLAGFGATVFIIVALVLMMEIILHNIFTVVFSILPLEFYHLPRWFKAMILFTCPTILPHFLAKSTLEEDAKKRSAHLNKVFKLRQADHQAKHTIEFEDQARMNTMLFEGEQQGSQFFEAPRLPPVLSPGVATAQETSTDMDLSYKLASAIQSSLPPATLGTSASAEAVREDSEKNESTRLQFTV